MNVMWRCERLSLDNHVSSPTLSLRDEKQETGLSADCQQRLCCQSNGLPTYARSQQGDDRSWVPTLRIDTVVLFFSSWAGCRQVVVMGLVVGPNTYLRNSWNRLDFFIVLIGLFGMITGFLGSKAKMLERLPTSFLRALRTFRALRPIRMASRAEGMKVVVNALFQSFPGVRGEQLTLTLTLVQSPHTCAS